MWPLVMPLVDRALAIPINDVATALRVLAERARVIAGDAGALAAAAAITSRAAGGTSALSPPQHQPEHSGRDAHQAC